jgi:hypothetical protein
MTEEVKMFLAAVEKDQSTGSGASLALMGNDD